MSRRLALPLALLLLAAAPAHAGDPAAQARELFQKGSQALAAGKSQEAIEIFEEAYKAGNSPSLLFYLGEAYRQAGKSAKAIEEYQAYLQKVPAGPKRAEAEARLAELRSAAAAPAPSKRKVSLDDMDLESAAEKGRPKKPEQKKIELDDVQLAGGQTAPAPKPKRAHKSRGGLSAAEQAAFDKVAADKAAADKLAAEKAAADKLAADKAAADKLAAEKLAADKAAAEKLAADKAAAEKLAADKAAAEKLAADKAAAEKLAADKAAARRTASSSRPGSILPPRSALPPAPVESAAPRSDGSGMRIAGVVVGSVGVAALAAGALLGVGAKTASNEVSDAAAAGQPFDPGVQSRGQRDQTLEIAFLAGGGAALVGGALLYLLSPSAHDDARAEGSANDTVHLEAIALAPAAGGLAASAALRF